MVKLQQQKIKHTRSRVRVVNLCVCVCVCVHAYVCMPTEPNMRMNVKKTESVDALDRADSTMYTCVELTTDLQ